MSDYFEFIAPNIVTINSLRQQYKNKFYNQDWYLGEIFANRPLDGKLHKVTIEVIPELRGLPPPKTNHRLLSAGVATYAFIAYWLETGRILWGHDYTWTNDNDSHGDQIYVGGFFLGHQRGFEIHRHLKLREWHSAALEVD